LTKYFSTISSFHHKDYRGTSDRQTAEEDTVPSVIGRDSVYAVPGGFEFGGSGTMQNTQQAFSGAIPRGTMGNIASNYETIRESNDDNLRNLILDT
jgi:hypothetical protein